MAPTEPIQRGAQSDVFHLLLQINEAVYKREAPFPLAPDSSRYNKFLGQTFFGAKAGIDVSENF
jgi:hypothetical protein